MEKKNFETWRRRRFSGLKSHQATAEVLFIGLFFSLLRWIQFL